MKDKTGEFSPVDARRAAGGMRLRGLVRKEFLQILRDPSSIAIAFLMPVLLLFLFGYGVSLDAEHVPVGIVVEKPDQDTSRFIGSFMQSRYFEPVLMFSMAEAVHALESGTVDAVIHLRQDFSKTLKASGDAPVQVIVNGVDANTARIISGYIEGAWIKWLGQEAKATGTDLRIPVQIEQRVWFNSELQQPQFPRARPDRHHHDPDRRPADRPGDGPGMGTRHNGGACWSPRCTMRNTARQTHSLLYSRHGRHGAVVLLAVCLFDVPLSGSVLGPLRGLVAVPADCTGDGLLISTVTKNQFVAGQVAIIITFLPAFILSGFIFDIDSMPAPIQVITHVLAARYFVSDPPDNIPGGHYLVGDRGTHWPCVVMATVLPRSQPAEVAQTS